MGQSKRTNISSVPLSRAFNEHNEPDSAHIMSSIPVEERRYFAVYIQFRSTRFSEKHRPTFVPTAKHWWEGTTALISGFLVHSP